MSLAKRGLFLGLALLAYFLMLSSALEKSATVDEQSHLFRGVAYLKTGATQFLLGHPIFGSTLSAVPLLTEQTLELPLTDPAWEAGNWSIAGDLFLWQLNDNPKRLLFLGRQPVIWLTLLLGALAFSWARQLKGSNAGLLAATFTLMNPNIIAHGRLITGDLPLTFFYLLAVYGFWRWYRQTEQNLSASLSLLAAGIGIGLAAATKFNAGLLVPTLGLLAIGVAYSRRTIRPVVIAVAAGLLGWVVIWAVYRFDFTPLPGGAFWDDLFWELQYFSRPHGAYLAGQSSPTGWWYYFPITFLIKTPLPMLIGLLFGGWLAFKHWKNNRFRHHLVPIAFLVLPPLLYFIVSMTGSLNIGYRYLSPTLPFIAIGLGVVLTHPSINRIWRWFLPLWLLAISLFIFPDYIPYFNIFAGGSNNGWKILSDSNVDWGQDLPALARWQAENGRPLNLSYFGTAHPSAYGLEFEPLPTWSPAPEKALPGRQPFYPSDPAPGWYAISVTNLHGVVLGTGNQDTFAWFRERQPQVRIGNSIFIYEVEARGEPADVAFSGLEPRALTADLYNRFQTNDLKIRWFDANQSLIIPGRDGWLAITKDQGINPFISPFLTSPPSAESGQIFLYEQPELNLDDFSGGGPELGGTVRFLGFEMIPDADEIRLITAWQVLAETDQPLKIFVHALAPNGRIATQWDGLDVDPASWQPGDRFIQLHQFPTPNLENWQMSTGMYDSQTLERLGEPLTLEMEPETGQ